MVVRLLVKYLLYCDLISSLNMILLGLAVMDTYDITIVTMLYSHYLWLTGLQHVWPIRPNFTLIIETCTPMYYCWLLGFNFAYLRLGLVVFIREMMIVCDYVGLIVHGIPIL